MGGTNPLQDRETVEYHFRRGFETWYGVAIKAEDAAGARNLAEELNKMLEDLPSDTHMPARTDGSVVFATGRYDPDSLEKIRKYGREHSPLTVILEGSYFDLLGKRWLDHAREDYGL